jgi:hypothetical protein
MLSRNDTDEANELGLKPNMPSKGTFINAKPLSSYANPTV